MLGFAIPLTAAIFFSAPVPPAERTGTVVSVSVAASGVSLTIVGESGAQSSVLVAADATVRERETGGDWHSVSLAGLKSGEHVTLRLDDAGRARSVDAEYALVQTRAVVVQGGYLIDTDGVAHKLSDAVIASASIPLGSYVQLRVNPATGTAFDAVVSSHPFVTAKAANSVHVTFEVRVPINTPASSTIYLATNAQNWTANAVRLSPEPGNRWIGALDLAAGTVLQYKYTRGSWASGERDAAGEDIPNRTLTVTGSVAQHVEDVVVRWADLPS